MKIKEIKIINQDQSTEIANIGADAINVDYNDTTVKNELDKLNSNSNSLINKQTDLQNQINGLASGSPLVASSISEMTQTNKIYVNTTDGYWYYYNGTNWTQGDVYQSTGISESDPTVLAINTDIEQISELKENMFNLTNLQIGKNWTGGSAANRAVEYIAVNPNTEYTAEMLDLSTFTQIDLLEKATNTGAGSILVNNNITPAIPKKTITTSANTNYLCLQFQKSSTIEATDFSENTIYLYGGSSSIYGANDKTARKEIEDAITPFDTFKNLAGSRLSGEHRFGGYNLRTCVPYKPYVYQHTQEAHEQPYYNVSQTLKQYYKNEDIKLTKNICNNLKQEDIDFTPDANGFTRIIVGKNDDDLFFVSYVASDRKGQFGDGKYDKLEVTSDFVNFRTILRGSLDNVETNGIVLPNMTNIKVVSVKEFSDGTYIVAVRCKDTTNDTDYTHFYRMNASMTEINHCRYTNFNNEVVDMVDEFMGDVYDWHIFIAGNKALATTYGNRNPATDRGRVWYTENSGYSWKQVFETANHLPESVNAHTHGVMIDPYTNRLYVLVGENYSSIWYSDLGYNTTDNDWTKIPLYEMPVYNFQEGSQIVNGYPFRDGLIFGSDNSGCGAIYRINKLDDGSLSYIEPAHEFLPNKFNGTFYCAAELSRRDGKSPLFMCETHENAMLTEERNEQLNQYHKARVVATTNGFDFVEIWTDDTFGEREVYINKNATTRRYSMCTRGMNFWLLKNGNAIMKFSGRDYQYFGGDPMFSVIGNTGDSCKVRMFYNLEKYI